MHHQIRSRNYHSSRTTARTTTTRFPIKCVKSICLFIVMSIMIIALCFIQSILIETIEINTNYFSTRKTLSDIYTIIPGKGCEDLNPTIIQVANYYKHNPQDKGHWKNSNTCEKAAQYLHKTKYKQITLPSANKVKYDCMGIQLSFDYTGQHDNSRKFYFTVTPGIIKQQKATSPQNSVRSTDSTRSQPNTPTSYTKSEREKVVRKTPATPTEKDAQIIPSESKQVLYPGKQYGISFPIGNTGRTSKPFPFMCNKVYIDSGDKYIYEMQRLEEFGGKISTKETLNTFRTLQVIHVNKQKQFQTKDHKLVQIYQA